MTRLSSYRIMARELRDWAKVERTDQCFADADTADECATLLDSGSGTRDERTEARTMLANLWNRWLSSEAQNQSMESKRRNG